MLQSMKFEFVDRIIEQSDTHIVTLKAVSMAEEYLQDHFPSFPVLPGVFMLESLVQAARKLCESRDPEVGRLVLGGARALKYGTFVAPGATMRIEVTLAKQLDDGAFDFKGSATVLDPSKPLAPGEDAPTCVSGRITLRPLALSS